MASLQRFINEKLYELERNRLRKRNKRGTIQNTIRQSPQIIGFRVERQAMTRNRELSPYMYQRQPSRHSQQDMKHLIGIVLIVIGCLLLLTQCFTSSKRKSDDESSAGVLTQVLEVAENVVEDTVEDVTTLIGSSEETAEVATTLDVEAFRVHLQDFKIDETLIHNLLTYATKHKVEFAHTLAVWALESYRGTSETELYETLAKGQEGVALDSFGLYKEAQYMFEQFIYDLEYFPIKKKNKII